LRLELVISFRRRNALRLELVISFRRRNALRLELVISFRRRNALRLYDDVSKKTFSICSANRDKI